MQTKTCTKCGQDRPLTDYHARKTSRDGLQSRCKDCMRMDMREYMREYRRNAQAERIMRATQALYDAGVL